MNLGMKATRVLERQGLRPVLLDLGASGAPPDAWSKLAKACVYVGFDPDHREFSKSQSSLFHDSTIMDRAVTATPQATATFHLTRSPYCSSTLQPDAQSLAHYLFAGLFQVERSVTVSATTLNEALAALKIDHIDWFKADTQGTDLRLFRSLSSGIRSKVLAVDVEPGLVDAYKGEDLFAPAHTALLGEGFWMAGCNVLGTARIHAHTLEHLLTQHPKLNPDWVARASSMAPCWVEARYLRTVGHLLDSGAGVAELVKLWAFSVSLGHLGFGLDVAEAYASIAGRDALYHVLWNTCVQGIRGAPRTPAERVRAALPSSAWSLARRIKAGWFKARGEVGG
jgi:hypothetical protein